MSGRKVELDELNVPYLELESSTSVKSVPVMPTPTREEANDIQNHKLGEAMFDEDDIFC